MEGFLHYRFGGAYIILEGPIHAGAYFRNFTVFLFETLHLTPRDIFVRHVILSSSAISSLQLLRFQ